MRVMTKPDCNNEIDFIKQLETLRDSGDNALTTDEIMTLTRSDEDPVQSPK